MGISSMMRSYAFGVTRVPCACRRHLLCQTRSPKVCSVSWRQPSAPAPCPVPSRFSGWRVRGFLEYLKPNQTHTSARRASRKNPAGPRSSDNSRNVAPMELIEGHSSRIRRQCRQPHPHLPISATHRPVCKVAVKLCSLAHPLFPSGPSSGSIEKQFLPQGCSVGCGSGLLAVALLIGLLA